MMEVLAVCLCVAVFSYYIYPYLAKGERYTPNYWDVLTVWPAVYLPVIREKKIFAGNFTTVDQAQCGLPRYAYYSEFDALLWLVKAFGICRATIVQRIWTSAVAFTGMYLLLRWHVPGVGDFPVANILAALCFSLLPFVAFMSCSVSGIPLAVFAVLALQQGDASWYNWLILLIFPLFSTFAFSSVIMLPLYALFWVCTCLAGSASLYALAGLALLGISSLLANYRLLLVTLARIPTSRHLRRPDARNTWVPWFSRAWRDIWYGNYVNSWLLPILLPTLLAGWFCLPAGSTARHIFVFLPAFSLGMAFMTNAMYYSQSLGRLYREYVYPLVTMDPTRIWIVFPTVYYVLFGMSLAGICGRVPHGQYLAAILAILQCLYITSKNEAHNKTYAMTFKSYYAREQYAEIIQHIGAPLASYRVLSVGLDPGIAIYNGLHTVDGPGGGMYPASNFLEFYAMARQEIQKNPKADILIHYDTPSILYVAELEYLFGCHPYGKYRAGNTMILQHLDIDYGKLHAMGGRYLLSAVRINEANHPALRFERGFSRSDSLWDVYLYRVLETASRE